MALSQPYFMHFVVKVLILQERNSTHQILNYLCLTPNLLTPNLPPPEIGGDSDRWTELLPEGSGPLLV